MRTLGRSSLVVIGVLVAACGGSGSNPGTGGGGSGGTGNLPVCPLDAKAKERVEVIGSATVAAPVWILTQSHGHGQFASRGFGTTVPFTTMAALHSASLMQACTAPNEFAQYCEPAEPGAPSRCSQLVCDGAGKMTTKAWLDGLPAKVAAEPPPGEVTVRALAHDTHFEEVGTGTDELALRWEGSVEVQLSDGTTVTWTQQGTGSTGGAAEASATIHDAIAGLGAKAIAVEGTVGEHGGSGQITYEGQVIATFADGGLTWTGPCAE